jgi:hypothetical protein
MNKTINKSGGVLVKKRCLKRVSLFVVTMKQQYQQIE